MSQVGPGIEVDPNRDRPSPELVSAKAKFIEPMLLLRTEKLPEGPDWLYELKFDGYRALAITDHAEGTLSGVGREALLDQRAKIRARPRSSSWA